MLVLNSSGQRLLCVSTLLLTSLVVGCAGSDQRDGPRRDRVVIDRDVTDDVLTAGREVRIDAAVQGDVAAAAADVTIRGPVAGYVMSAGRTVRLEGAVDNDVWAAGQDVDVDSRIANNAMIAGRVVRLGRGSSVGHDARLAGGYVRSEARIDRNLSIGAETAEIGGEVGGEVHASAQRVRVLPGATVHGDLIVRSPLAPEISPDARVMGSVRHETIDHGSWPGWPVVWLWSFLSLFSVSIVALTFSPVWTARVAAVMSRRTGSSLLTGLLLIVGGPIAIVLLAVTIVGIPLAIVALALYVTALILAAAFVAYRVGTWLLERAHRQNTSRWSATGLGALVVSLGFSLPVVGTLVALAVAMAGAGAIVLERREVRAHG